MEHIPNQFVTVSQLIEASPYEVIVHPKAQSLLTLIAMVEGSQARVEIFRKNPAGDENCPAMSEYALEWDDAHEKIMELVKQVTDLADKHIEEIDGLASTFEFSRRVITAACPKENCKDREGAQEELGWQDGKEVIQ